MNAGEAIALGRRKHSLLRPAHTPRPIALAAVGEAVRSLIQKALEVDPYYLAQQATIYFDLAAVNRPESLSAGAEGGAAIAVGAASIAETAAGPAGAAIGPEVASALQILEAEPLDAATATTGTVTGAGWTTNQLQGGLVRVVSGPGWGEERDIESNTADTFTVADWTALAGSLVSIWTAQGALVQDGVVTQLPPVTERRGYLVRTDANGVPYIDFTAPLLATYHAPIALPPAYAFPSGDVHFSVSQTPFPFAVVPPGQRYGKVPRYSGYVVGRSLYLLGDEADWAGVRNLQIHFVPAPEDPTDEDEVLLVDATAQDVLASVVALLLAERLEGTDQMPDKVLASLRQRAETDQQLWLARVVAGGSAISASYISDPLP